MTKKKYYVYIVECADGSYYTGLTNDLLKRIKCHNEGKGAKYTRSRLPVKLIFQERLVSHKHAAQREAEIKSWTRQQKIDLIENK